MSSGDTKSVCTGTRLKREDCKHTKHDFAFSRWKIIIGSSDWEDYLLKKEGAEKYRTRNLPNCSSCPGIYELGIAVLGSRSGRDVGKLDKSCIIPVYLGQTDNIRTRLQQYGREGAHLDNGSSNSELNDGKGRGLLTEIFSRGFSIVYRWTPVSIYYFQDQWNAHFDMRSSNNAPLRRKEGGDSGLYSYGGRRGGDSGLYSYGLHHKFSVTNWLSSLHVNQMYNKKDAEKAERQLLGTFDYAWNKGSNSARRPDDILRKLDHGTSSATLTSIVRKLQNFRQGQVGLKIKTCKPLVLDNGPTLLTNLENHGIFSRIFKFGKSQPVLVPLRPGINEDPTTICGVALGQGSVCTRPPVEGRKRCPEHKGMKVNGSSSKLKKEGKSQPVLVPLRPGINEDPTTICGVALGQGSVCTRPPVEGRKRCPEHKGMKVNGSSSKLKKEGKFCISDPSTGSSIVSDLDEIKDFTTTCGAPLDDGSSCTKEPVQGRKRCAAHKGMKICGIRSELVMEGKQRNVHGAIMEPGTHCDDQVQFQVFAESSCRTKDGNTICGVCLEDGTICARQPGLGRKRCEEHKGLRVNKHTAMLKAEVPTTFDVSGVDRRNGQSVSYRNSFNDDISSTCGANTHGGSFCKRKPATGGKFCWQHGGMDVSGVDRRNGQSVSYRNSFNDDISSTCGAITRGGSFCKRKPATGGKFCWQHA
ncbi:hypothetical protein RJ640_021631 [Escallonia rubra]|uniref:Protein EFFECTOR OF TRANSCRIPTION 2-like n=1 Tax=Escallonia rubra TaxID=112253 RepID=A0AA88RPW9_9ASTE|nr:hypothetical protein RJ640_021631 [Escallonia rubra]